MSAEPVSKITLRSTPTSANLIDGDAETYLAVTLAHREAAARQAGQQEAFVALGSLVEQAVERIDEGKEHMLQTLGHDALELALEIASHVLRKEIVKGDYDLEKIVRETLAAAQTGRATCTIFVHPEDAIRLEKVPFRAGTHLQADETVSRGSLRVQSRAGFMVRDIDECVRNIGDRLREVLA